MDLIIRNIPRKGTGNDIGLVFPAESKSTVFSLNSVTLEAILRPAVAVHTLIIFSHTDFEHKAVVLNSDLPSEFIGGRIGDIPATGTIEKCLRTNLP
jgi:hypothetical protein